LLENLMLRYGRNVNQEWGYVASGPGVMRTVGLILRGRSLALIKNPDAPAVRRLEEEGWNG
jgi:hypothetical protein